jgi:hypothetical protein
VRAASGGESAMSSNPVDEWSFVREQFEALVRECSDNMEDLLDAEFRSRFSQLITRVAERENRTKRSTKI